MMYVYSKNYYSLALNGNININYCIDNINLVLENSITGSLGNFEEFISGFSVLFHIPIIIPITYLLEYSDFIVHFEILYGVA